MIGGLAKLAPLMALSATIAGSGDEIEAMGAKAMDTVMEVKTSFELRGISQSIYLDVINGGSVPTDLRSYIHSTMDSMSGDPAIDAWQQSYELENGRDGTYLLSCGPDARCGTGDDIRVLIMDASGRRKSSKY